MKALLLIAAAVALVLTIVPSFLVFSGLIDWETHANLMLAGMILWFGSASWYRKPSEQ